MIRRLLAMTALAATALVAVAGPALGDPAQPTNYESKVLAVTPATDAITIKVVGGDGFLDLHVRKGHTVIVHGYGTSGYGTTDTGEPWLRIAADGTVSENQNSPATYLNANRYGTKPNFPPGFDIDKATTLAPVWTVVGHDGSYVWHDHRIHWMGLHQKPPLVPGTDKVRLNDRPDGNWIVPLDVDGKPVSVRGELILHNAPSPIPWFALIVVGAGVVVALSLLADPVRAGTAAALAAGALGVYAGVEQRAVVPNAAGGTPLAWLLPAAAVLLAAIALVLRNRPARVIAVLAASACVIGWGLLDLDALWKAMPLSALPTAAAHALQAACLGLAAGAAVAAVRSGALAAPSLATPDDPPPPAGPDTSNPDTSNPNYLMHDPRRAPTPRPAPGATPTSTAADRHRPRMEPPLAFLR